MKKILWVEDSESFIHAYRFIFKGHQVEISNSLIDALLIIENNAYDIVFSDGNLGTGYEAGGVLITKKAIEKGFPVIAMSSESDLNNAMFIAGAVEIMKKSDASPRRVRELIENFAL